MGKTGDKLRFRTAEQGDAAPIAAIYNDYVEHSIFTFEEIPVGAEEMAKRVVDIRSRNLPWLLAIEDEEILGYAYASPWKARSGYRFSVETTIYLAQGHVRQGIGTRLYTALLSALREGGFHTAIAGIALPNPESVALHERFGFREVADLSQVGFKKARWIDVGYWQLLLAPDDSGSQPDQSHYPKP